MGFLEYRICYDILRVCSIAGALSLSTAGCAFSDVNVTFPDKAGGNHTNVGRGREVIVALPLVDARKIRDRCGMQKNGYNMDTANVPCSVQPTKWFGKSPGQRATRARFRRVSGAEHA
jgi:hypothetical protein